MLMVAVVGRLSHYCDVIKGAMTSQITSLTSFYSTVYSGADQRKHKSSVSLAFVIHRWPVNSPHKGSVTWKMFPFADVIMYMKNVKHLPHLISGEKWMTEKTNAVPYINSRHRWWRPKGHFHHQSTIYQLWTAIVLAQGTTCPHPYRPGNPIGRGKLFFNGLSTDESNC